MTQNLGLKRIREKGPEPLKLRVLWDKSPKENKNQSKQLKSLQTSVLCILVHPLLP
jgi:hypothetical protein